MARNNRLLQLASAALCLGCITWAHASAAFGCSTPPPSLNFSYPDESSAPLAPDAVLWAVGNTEVVVRGAYLDRRDWSDPQGPDDGMWLEPRGSAPPDNWQIVPSSPLSVGRHRVDFVFYNLYDESEAGVSVEFEVADGERSSPDPSEPALTFSELQHFRVDPILFGVEQETLRAELDRLASQPGDCSERIRQQRNGCYWFEHGGLADIWNTLPSADAQPLWARFRMREDAVGFVMGQRFVPADCVSGAWEVTLHGAAGVEALPLLKTGFGSPVPLDETLVKVWELPPRRLPPTRRGEPMWCSMPLGPAREVGAAPLLVLLAGALARRRACLTRPR